MFINPVSNWKFSFLGGDGQYFFLSFFGYMALLVWQIYRYIDQTNRQKKTTFCWCIERLSYFKIWKTDCKSLNKRWQPVSPTLLFALMPFHAVVNGWCFHFFPQQPKHSHSWIPGSALSFIFLCYLCHVTLHFLLAIFSIIFKTNKTMYMIS